MNGDPVVPEYPFRLILLPFSTGFGWPGADVHQHRAKVRLDRINAAVVLEGLRVPPSHRLERLNDKRKGLHSMQMSEQWRICFRRKEDDAYNVEIFDYRK
jgi:proteic killer suppression protein